MMRPAETAGTGDLRMSVARFFLPSRAASDEDLSKGGAGSIEFWGGWKWSLSAFVPFEAALF
jgi:hypothetical protein